MVVAFQKSSPTDAQAYFRPSEGKGWMQHASHKNRHLEL
jgi:hypothetical protein